MDGLSPLSLPGLAISADPRALGDRQQVEQVADGFESMFASLLLKQMRETLESDTMFGQDHGDVLGGMFDFYLGQHLAQSGGLGIGAMVRRQLSSSRTGHEPTPTGQQHRG